MIEKPLIIWLFMFSVSGFILVGQFVADAFGITLTNWDGVQIKSNLLTILDIDSINTITETIISVNDTRNTTLDAVTQSFELGLNIGFELLTLLTGTYMFNVMYLLGVPPIAIAIMVVLYAVMLGRAIIAYLRGV